MYPGICPGTRVGCPGTIGRDSKTCSNLTKIPSNTSVLAQTQPCSSTGSPSSHPRQPPLLPPTLPPRHPPGPSPLSPLPPPSRHLQERRAIAWSRAVFSLASPFVGKHRPEIKDCCDPKSATLPSRALRPLRFPL
eukprot:432215-Rhodomonas_salina.1